MFLSGHITVRPFTKIKTKITLVVTVLIFFVLFFMYLFFPAWQKKQAIAAISDKAQSIAQMTAYSLSPALVFADSEAIEQVIAGAKQNKDLAYVFVVDNDGHLLARFSHDKEGKINSYQTRINGSISQNDASHNVITPILSQGQKIGRLYLGISLKKMNGEITRSRRFIGLLSFSIFLLGVILAFSTSNIITHPLNMIVETVEQITEGDLSRRAPVLTHDEVGRLAEAFNQMVESVEKSTDALAKSNKQLQLSDQILSNIGNLALVADRQGKIVYASDSFEKILGYTKDEVLDDGWVNLTRSSEQDRLEEKTYLAKAAKGEIQYKESSYERLVFDKAGKKHWILWQDAPGPDGLLIGIGLDITDRKQSEQKYFSLFNQIPDAIVIFDKETKQFLDCNDQVTRLYGYSKSEFIKLTPFDLHPPEELERVKEKIDTKNPHHPNRYTHLAKNGRRMDVEIVTDEIEYQGKPAWISIVRDITERLQAEKALARERWLMQTFMENIPDAVYFKDAQGRFLRVNKAQAERLRLENPKEAVGKTDFDFFEKENARVVREEELEVIRSGQISVKEQAKVFTNGRKTWVSGTKVPLRDDEGEIIGVFGITRDITERKMAEEQLEAFTAQLVSSNKELQDFAFIASHDLQEPLRKVRAFGDRLWSKYSNALGEQGHDHLARMQNATARMQSLISALLSYSHLSLNAQPFASTDLSAIAKQVVNDLRPKLESAGARVTIGKLPVVRGDARQMRQLFQNLIDNALKFRKEGVVPVIHIHNGHAGEMDISDKSLFKNGFVYISVEDNGIGFEQKYIDRIFTVFKKLHSSDKYQGTGMGLTICRKIVERHGGSITAKSTPGKGATFIISLPNELTKEKA